MHSMVALNGKNLLALQCMAVALERRGFYLILKIGRNSNPCSTNWLHNMCHIHDIIMYNQPLKCIKYVTSHMTNSLMLYDFSYFI